MPTLQVSGRSHSIEGEVVLGRHRDCAIRIGDQAASRQHARIFPADGQWWIEDLGSANGTSLGETPLHGRAVLRDGAEIVIGELRIRFALAAAGVRASGLISADIVGKTIAGYRIDRELFKGPTGVVYVAHQLNLQRDVAFKVVKVPVDGAADFSTRFLQGMGRAASLQDEGFVRVHECGNDHDLLWYSMELVEGQSLDALIASDEVVDARFAAQMVAAAARTLQSAHAVGVFHHDLRPAVILHAVDPALGEARSKLCDVGLAAIFGRGRIGPGMSVSSAWYLSPEQVRGEKADARSDVYQLGAVLWHCVSGQPPFSGVTAREVGKAHCSEPLPEISELANIGRPLAKALHAMMAKHPAQRPQSALEAAILLEGAISGIGRAQAPRDRAQIVKENAARSQARSEQRERHARNRSIATLVAIGVIAIIGVAVAMQAPKWLADPAPSTPSRNNTNATANTNTPTDTGAPNNSNPVVPVNTSSGVGIDPRWQAINAECKAFIAAEQWSQGESVLRRFRATVSAKPDTLRLVELSEQSLLAEAGTWTSARLRQLPGNESAEQLAERLRVLADLRRRVASPQRQTIEGLWDETLALLGQKIQIAHSAARRAVEDQRFADLPKAAAGLAAYVKGTPLSALHVRLAALTDEASRLSKDWQSRAATANGAQALAAIAGYRLLGRTADARALFAKLGNDAALLRRFQAMSGGSAVVLNFSDPGDLASLDIVLGEVEMRDGRLTGKPGDPITLQVAVPAGAFDATLVLAAKARGDKPLALVTLGDAVQLDLLGAATKIRIGNEDTLLGNAPITAIRLQRRAGRLTVLMGGQQLADGVVPMEATMLQFNGNECDWSIDALHIIGE